MTAGEAVAVEDSPHGAAAAKAAGLRCIAIPNAHVGPESFDSAELILKSAAYMGPTGRVGTSGCLNWFAGLVPGLDGPAHADSVIPHKESRRCR